MRSWRQFLRLVERPLRPPQRNSDDLRDRMNAVTLHQAFFGAELSNSEAVATRFFRPPRVNHSPPSKRWSLSYNIIYLNFFSPVNCSINDGVIAKRTYVTTARTQTEKFRFFLDGLLSICVRATRQATAQKRFTLRH